MTVALLVPVPEAEELVNPFRERYDPSTLEGMGAHITINYPFMPNQTDRQALLDDLTALFARFEPVEYSLTGLRRFPNTLYLAVDPEQPIKAMVDAVASEYPESPPYGGAIADVIPHVTVAESISGADFDEVAAEFDQASAGRLPIASTADEVWLMELIDGMWTKTQSFPLAA